MCTWAVQANDRLQRSAGGLRQWSATAAGWQDDRRQQIDRDTIEPLQGDTARLVRLAAEIEQLAAEVDRRLEQ